MWSRKRVLIKNASSEAWDGQLKSARVKFGVYWLRHRDITWWSSTHEAEKRTFWFSGHRRRRHCAMESKHEISLPSPIHVTEPQARSVLRLYSLLNSFARFKSTRPWYFKNWKCLMYFPVFYFFYYSVGLFLLERSVLAFNCSAASFS